MLFTNFEGKKLARPVGPCAKILNKLLQSPYVLCLCFFRFAWHNTNVYLCFNLRSGKQFPKMSSPGTDTSTSYSSQTNAQNIEVILVGTITQHAMILSHVRTSSTTGSTTTTFLVPVKESTLIPSPRSFPFNRSTSFFQLSSMPPPRYYQYGMPQSMMTGHQLNWSMYDDNTMVTGLPFTHHNASAATLSNGGRPWGICYIPQITPLLNTTSVMALRKQMDEIKFELYNNLIQ